MKIYQFFDDISFLGLRNDLARCTPSNLKKDLIASCNVALITIPQAIVFSLAAGLPISCGLLTAIFAAMVTAIFGSSSHLAVGASNTIAILIQSGMLQILHNNFRDLTGPDRDQMVFNILTQLTLLIAVFQILAAFFRLGRLTQFVSHSVIEGYLVGVTCAIGVTQLYSLLGIPVYQGVHSVYERAIHLISNSVAIDYSTTLVGLLSLALLIGIRRIDKRLPAGIITLIIVSALVYVEGLLETVGFFGLMEPQSLDQVHHVSLVSDSGILSELNFGIFMPYFNTAIMNDILSLAFAISLLSVLETVTLAKSIAVHSGQRLSVNQEILGLGMGHLVSAFIGGMPMSASASRSNLNYHSGAQTRFASVFSACLVGILVFFFEPLVSKIPLASLAALLLVTVLNIVNVKQLSLCFRATTHDAFVLWITILSCIFFSLDVAFYIGVALSIILYLKKASAPHVIEYDLEEDGSFHNISPTNRLEPRNIRFIKVEGELFFGAADILQTTLQSFAVGGSKTKVLILQMKNARDMDATACLALQQLNNYLIQSNRFLVVCGITPQVWQVLFNSGVAGQIGQDNLFLFEEQHPKLHMQQALKRAKALIAALPAERPEELQQTSPVLAVENGV